MKMADGLEGTPMATAANLKPLSPPALTAEEAEMARSAQRCIMAALDHSKAATITVESEDGSQPAIQLPPQALRLIAQVLGAMSEGRSVMLTPAHRELSTVEAAHFLNVSRPFVIKEIEAGRLRHRLVGSHRRIEFSDLVAYRQQMHAKRSDALQRMADDASELGLEY
jgi:excisionase family DNA binding protein